MFTNFVLLVLLISQNDGGGLAEWGASHTACLGQQLHLGLAETIVVEALYYAHTLTQRHNPYRKNARQNFSKPEDSFCINRKN